MSVLPFSISTFDKAEILKNLNRFVIKVKGKKEISLLYVGKIEEQKGVFRLIEDVKKLPKNLHLLIVGSGEREEKLKKEIEGVTNIKYTGQKSKTELNDYYKNADILVVPSLCFENRPQVIIEAYKNNLPVIAHKIGGIPEIVINGETGMLIDNKDRLSFQNIFK
jgi:glycosyltransferase involved in cell wall biosynthesis